MGDTTNWKVRAKQELINAIEARKTGYEGKARFVLEELPVILSVNTCTVKVIKLRMKAHIIA